MGWKSNIIGPVTWHVIIHVICHVAIVIHVTSHVNLHINIMLLMVDVATLSMANIHVETIYDIYFRYKYWLGLDYGAEDILWRFQNIMD